MYGLTWNSTDNVWCPNTIFHQNLYSGYRDETYRINTNISNIHLSHALFWKNIKTKENDNAFCSPVSLLALYQYSEALGILSAEYPEHHLLVPAAAAGNSHELGGLDSVTLATEQWSAKIKINTKLLSFLLSAENESSYCWPILATGNLFGCCCWWWCLL